VSVVLAACAAALFGVGTYLVLQRKLSRIIIGLGLLSHGGNVLWLTSGQGGREPIIGESEASSMADPLPHALALTTIVITFGVSALLLALAFRSWILTRDDEVENDVADILVAGGGVASRDVSDERTAEREADELAAVAAGQAAERDEEWGLF
jgi:multicomponent Na+:H+ antiporter subunit C